MNEDPMNVMAAFDDALVANYGRWTAAFGTTDLLVVIDLSDNSMRGIARQGVPLDADLRKRLDRHLATLTQPASEIRPPLAFWLATLFPDDEHEDPTCVPVGVTQRPDGSFALAEASFAREVTS